MSLITGLPAIAALFLCMRRGPSSALLNVFIPTLLLVPEAYRWSIAGHLTFNENAIWPVAVFVLLEAWRTWRWTFSDVLVIALVAVMMVAQYWNSNFAETRNIGLHAMLTVLCPYLVAKALLRDDAVSISMAKRIGVILAIVAVIGLYELLRGIDPFEEVLRPFFPGQSPAVPFVRFGMTRTAGPYGHAIIAGIVFAVGYRIVRWLDWSKLWEGDIPYLPISKVRLSEGLIVAGCVMTISRGPWIAAVAAAAIIFLCRTRNRGRAMAWAVAASIVAAVPICRATLAYISMSRLSTTTALQRNAAYRYELAQRYLPVIEKRPLLGWGLGHVPLVGDLFSIDNHYLYLALNYGLIASGLLVAILLWSSIRLLRRALLLPRDDPKASLLFNLLGALIVIAVSATTSWLGGQPEQLLFLIVGWSECVLIAQARAEGAGPAFGGTDDPAEVVDGPAIAGAAILRSFPSQGRSSKIGKPDS
jgi:hypothetical protein